MVNRLFFIFLLPNKVERLSPCQHPKAYKCRECKNSEHYKNNQILCNVNAENTFKIGFKPA